MSASTGRKWAAAKTSYLDQHGNFSPGKGPSGSWLVTALTRAPELKCIDDPLSVEAEGPEWVTVGFFNGHHVNSYNQHVEMVETAQQLSCTCRGIKLTDEWGNKVWGIMGKEPTDEKGSSKGKVCLPSQFVPCVPVLQDEGTGRQYVVGYSGHFTSDVLEYIRVQPEVEYIYRTNGSYIVCANENGLGWDERTALVTRGGGHFLQKYCIPARPYRNCWNMPLGTFFLPDATAGNNDDEKPRY